MRVSKSFILRKAAEAENAMRKEVGGHERITISQEKRYIFLEAKTNGKVTPSQIVADFSIILSCLRKNHFTKLKKKVSVYTMLMIKCGSVAFKSLKCICDHVQILFIECP